MNRVVLGVGGGLAALGLAARTAYRRRAANRRERLDVYFADGSFVTYVEGSSEAEKLLPVARRVLAAVHETPARWPIEQ